MSCNLCITVYNTIPAGFKCKLGRDFALHSNLWDPFTTPFVMGKSPNDEFHCMTMSKLCGSFTGRQGDFLVHSPNNILVLQPKAGMSITFGSTLFPTGESHIMHVPTPERISFKIATGSVIVGLEGEEADRKVHSIALFLSVHQNDVPSLENFLLASVSHCEEMWKRISGDVPSFSALKPRLELKGILAKRMECCESPKIVDARAVGAKSAVRDEDGAGHKSQKASP
jgi:hypothetical protein